MKETQENPVEMLEQQIEDQQAKLKATKMVLSAIKKKEKKNMPFSRTMLGGALFGTVRLVTSPFAAMHEGVSERIHNPFGVKSDKILKRSYALLEKAEKLNREENEKASTVMCDVLAKHTMIIDNFCDANEDYAIIHEDTYKFLRREIERLRPPKDAEKTAKMKAEVLQLINTEA